jgi:hypothetical protein
MISRRETRYMAHCIHHIFNRIMWSCTLRNGSLNCMIYDAV